AAKPAPIKAEAAKPAPIKAEAAKPAPAKAEAAKPAPIKAEAAPVHAKAAPKAVGAKSEGKAPEKARNQAADTGSTDIGAYIARAKANGRDPALIKGTEGINVADDGVRYSGPLDNESSREKAAEKLLVIDQFECISCGTCVEQTEKVFYLPIDAKATPIAQDGPMDLIQDAIEACPVTCIHWVTPDEAVERNLTSGVES
ncbi:MAG: ferredoxin, partial [Hylemonella sp.]|nr:ferredoxin [Hylemonella sp.]